MECAYLGSCLSYLLCRSWSLSNRVERHLHYNYTLQDYGVTQKHPLWNACVIHPLYVENETTTWHKRRKVSPTNKTECKERRQLQNPHIQMVLLVGWLLNFAHWRVRGTWARNGYKKKTNTSANICCYCCRSCSSCWLLWVRYPGSMLLLLLLATNAEACWSSYGFSISSWWLYTLGQTAAANWLVGWFACVRAFSFMDLGWPYHWRSGGT